ncbi:GRB2-related adapter protein 2b isoform 2-T2 [Polymixia lowei]
MEATAKYDFDATADDELSFKKGNQFIILGTNDDWYKAELNGSEGFVPKNYINIHIPSWYQEDASRKDSQDSLMAQPVGSFLIRGSQSSPGDFSISVRHEGDVQHFKVLRDSRGQYYVWSESFPSLNQLVEYYKRNSVSNNSRILLQEAGQSRGARASLPPLPVSQAPRVSAPPPQLQRVPPSRQQVRALYSFSAEEKDELDFSAGDIIEVLEQSDPSWWKGQLRGQTGLFPSNYTRPV